MKKAAHVYYSGSVQGVGFRYTARHLAEALGLAGWVKNLPDGRVELLAEGEESLLKEFLASIRAEMDHYRFEETVDWQPAGGDLISFEIRF